jgi:ketol-acid reductoisomerase
MMRVYHDQDADLGLLQDRQIAVIGYGNQGRAQALNLRDSGLGVLVGNRDDAYARQARDDGFFVFPIPQAASEADVLMLLVPDEVAPEVFKREIAPNLADNDALVFASGYNIAFGSIVPPAAVDVVLVAPRMIGAGVRELYLEGRGFPSFIGVAADHTGHAKQLALALAKGIGSTRACVVEVTFAQEAELDLFTEQCFGPAFGHALTTAVDLLLEQGYPPEAVLLELYMSGELAYTLGKMAELGIIEQTALHSRTSQYGSMSRGMRYILPELRKKMETGLDEIRSGAFAQEWAEEQEAGSPTLTALQDAARSLPLHQVEQEVRQAIRYSPAPRPEESVPHRRDSDAGANAPASRRASISDALPGPQAESLKEQGQGAGRLSRLLRREKKTETASTPAVLTGDQMERVLRRFIARAAGDPALQAFALDRQLTTHYVLSDPQLAFYMRFQDGAVTGNMGPPPSPAQVRLETKAEILDGMFTGRTNPMRAVMTGKLSFSGDAKVAMSIQAVQGDLSRLYALAREEVTAETILDGDQR